MDNKSYPMPESDNTPTPSLLERPQPSLTEADPKVISNRYTVVDRLGEGGMGKVYRAIDPIINRTVAIKILPFNNYSDEQFRRFQQEARAASKLNHPGIVTALDFGLTDEQNPFLVMEHIEGETLDEMLMKNGPLEPEVFLSVFSQITCSMIHAHSKGVIHRDLKPSNIMINFDNGEVKAFVLDFGIAKLLDDADSLASTQTGQVVGSPRCISPEQIYGKNLDGRSDLYSLGCVMFEALTGEPPFKGETAMDTIQMHLNSKPPRLADKSASSFSNALEQLIARTLAKRAAERYQSMEGLLKALETIETEPEKQSPPDEADDTREKPSSTNLASTNLASTNLVKLAVVTILLVGVVLFLLISLIRAVDKEPRVEEKTNVLKTTPGSIFDIGDRTDLQHLENDTETELAKLTRLNLKYSNAKNRELKRLKFCTRLVNLDLAGTGITDEAIAYIAQSKTLKSLNLTQTPISGRALSQLDQSRINELYLRACGLDDDDLQEIASIKSIETLDIRENRDVSNIGLGYLSTLPRLKLVRLEKQNITASGLTAFKGKKGLSITIENCPRIAPSTFEYLSLKLGIKIKGAPEAQKKNSSPVF